MIQRPYCSTSIVLSGKCQCYAALTVLVFGLVFCCIQRLEKASMQRIANPPRFLSNILWIDCTKIVVISQFRNQEIDAKREAILRGSLERCETLEIQWKKGKHIWRQKKCSIHRVHISNDGLTLGNRCGLYHRVRKTRQQKLRAAS